MKKLLWIYLAFLLTTLGSPSTSYAGEFSNPAAKNLSVLTFNAWLLNNGMFDSQKSLYNEERTKFLVYSLIEMRPDVIELQEVRDEQAKTFIVSSLARAGYSSIIVTQETGLITATHFELKSFSIKDISFKKFLDNKKGLLQIVINHPTLGEIHIINASLENAHFDEGQLTYDQAASAVRLQQAMELKDYIIDEHVPEGKSVFVIGLDMNANILYWNGHQFSKHFLSYEEALFNLNSDLNAPTSTYLCPNKYYFSKLQSKCVPRSRLAIQPKDSTFTQGTCEDKKYYNEDLKQCVPDYYGDSTYRWCPPGFEFNQDLTKKYKNGVPYCKAKAVLNLTDSYSVANSGKTIVTYDTSENEFANQNMFINKPSELKDHIFLSKNENLTVVASTRILDQALTQEIANKINVKVRLKHLSDHYGILTTFKGK